MIRKKLKTILIFILKMYQNSFLESKKYNKIHIANDQEVRSLDLAPLIVEGGSVFKKQSYFLGSIIVGPTNQKKIGTLSFRDGQFMGYNGDEWVSFTKDNFWHHSDGVLYTEGNRIGINKINPRKTLEVGGDVLVEKKLFVMDELKVDGGLHLTENIGKKKPGAIRFWENSFEGFDGEKWIKFSGAQEIIEEKKEEKVDLTSVDKIKLNCPLTFKNNNMETHFYYNVETRDFRLEKLHSESYDPIHLEDLSIANLKINGDIIFPDGNKNRFTIKNVSDPIYNNEVATKKYVDQMCQGLQNYYVSDFLFMEGDGLINDKEDFTELILQRNIGDMKEKKYLFIMMRQRIELLEIMRVEEVDGRINLRLRNVSNIQAPAKVCVKEGRYGQSEYFIFDKEDGISFVQINGIESLEYKGSIVKSGKEICLKYDNNIFEEKDRFRLRDKSIQNNFLAANCITKENISNAAIESRHIGEGQIEGSHLGNKVVNTHHIMAKSIGDMHLKDGFLKNHHFSPGIITDKELGNECVGVTTLKPAIIMQKHLTKGCIMGEHISDGQIGGNHLEEKIVDSKNLREKIILSEHLSNNVIKSLHLNDKIIEARHLNGRIVMGEHLKEKVIGKEHLMMNIIGGLHIEEDALGGSHLKDQSVTDRHIVRKCIMDWHINDGSVKGVHLDDGCVDMSKIGEKVIQERHFGEGCVGGLAIRKGAIQSQHLGVSCVEDKHLVNFSIKGNKLMEGIITESKLCEGCVTTGKLKDGTITNEKIRLPFIKISSDPVFTCTQVVNLGETLNLGLNQNYMIPKRRDGVVEFMSSVRFGEEGTGQKMEVNMEMLVRGDAEFKGNLRVNRLEVNGEKMSEIGEIRGYWDKVKMSDKFLESWVKCDGKRVKRSDFYDLYKALGEGEDDEFNLPDIKMENMDYYIRYKMVF